MEVNLRNKIKEILMNEFVVDGFYDFEKWDSPAIDKLLELFRSQLKEELRDSLKRSRLVRKDGYLSEDGMYNVAVDDSNEKIDTELAGLENNYGNN